MRVGARRRPARGGRSPAPTFEWQIASDPLTPPAAARRGAPRAASPRTRPAWPTSLPGHLEEAAISLLLRHDLVEEREVVAEEEHRAGVRDPRVRARQLRPEEGGGHRGDVLVREADVGPHEAGVPRLHGRDPDRARGRVGTTMCVAMIFSASVMGRGGVVIRGGTVFPWRRATLYGKSPPYSTISRVISSSPSVKTVERHRLAPAAFSSTAEVGRREEPEVLAVLPVDPLDVLGHDELDPGRELGVRRLLARGALPAPPARYRSDEAAARRRLRRDGRSSAAVRPT